MHFLFVLFVLLLPLPAAAQDAATAIESQDPPATRIEADADAGVIRFIVKGEPVAVMDETGLHIRENVSYGGIMKDYGKSGFEAHPAENAGGADAE